MLFLGAFLEPPRPWGWEDLQRLGWALRRRLLRLGGLYRRLLGWGIHRRTAQQRRVWMLNHPAESTKGLSMSLLKIFIAYIAGCKRVVWFSNACIYNESGAWERHELSETGSLVGKYGPSLAARGASAAGASTLGAYLGAAGTTAAEISAGPFGIEASVLGALQFLAKECACKGGK